MKNRTADTAQREIARSKNFLISIYHQENHSWQGSIQWLDTGKKVNFRSELELMNLVNQAVQTGCTESEELRSWKDEQKIKAVSG